ncbi:MAG: HD family phosphohydrolase [bacterium]
MVNENKRTRPRKPLLRGFTKRVKPDKPEKAEQKLLSQNAKITLAVILSFFALLILLIPDFLFTPYPAELNTIPGKDVIAPFQVSIVDIEATNKAREQAVPAAALILSADTQATPKVLAELFTIFSTAQQISQKPNLAKTEQIEDLKRQISFPISDEALTALLRYSQYRKIPEVLDNVVSEVMARLTLNSEDLALIEQQPELLISADSGKSGKAELQYLPIKREDITVFSEIKRKAIRRLNQLLPNAEDSELRNALSELLNHVLYPTLRYDKDKSEQYLASLRNSIPPIKISIRRNDTIVAARENIAPAKKIVLDELNRIRIRAALGIMFGRAILLVLFGFFTALYLRTYYPKVIRDFNTITPACLLWVVTVAIARLVLWFNGSAYLVPIGAFAMLAGILFEVRFALVMVTSIAILLGVLVGLEVKHVLVFLLSGMIAALTVSHLKKRTDLIKAGLFISAVNLIGITVLFLFDQSMFSLASWLNWDLGKDILSGLANGILCYILTISLLPGFEKLFNLTTDWKLLEFSDTESELLKRLETEAPGTYQHSLNVSALADSAAAAIGANALLARIAAIYHDIGKLIKPEYFSENQMTDDEKKKHDKLSPYMSTLIIKNHIKHGLELAKENKLPPPVIDIIEQHHGTSLISYFYQEALEMNEKTEDGESLDEAHFRYLGPKPQTIESAIILLADSVEAATASLTNPDEGEIHTMVRKIVNERFADEQLEECELTLHDLHLITESFVRALLSKYHRRIEYPEQQPAESV